MQEKQFFLLDPAWTPGTKFVSANVLHWMNMIKNNHLLSPFLYVL